MPILCFSLVENVIFFKQIVVNLTQINKQPSLEFFHQYLARRTHVQRVINLF